MFIKELVLAVIVTYFNVLILGRFSLISLILLHSFYATVPILNLFLKALLITYVYIFNFKTFVFM